MNNPKSSQRRKFLSAMAAAGLAGMTGCGGGGGDTPTGMFQGGNMGNGAILPPTGLGAGAALRTPANFSGDTLTTAAGNYDLGGGVRAGAMLFNGQWPSPTIRVPVGGTLDITLRNQLAEATNIHWHGLAAAFGMDGHPTEVAKPNDNRRYTFAVNERPGTYWYHAHPDRATARHAYLGLAGLLIVDDGNDAARGLPTGARDIALVLADKWIENAAMVYRPNSADIMTGWMGNAILVNGTVGPVATVMEPAVIRLRLLNASNARILNPALASGRSFWLIATDGGLLPAPVMVNNLLLAPGERVEILLDLRGEAGQSVRLVSAAFAAMGSSLMGGMMGNAFPQGAAFDLVNFAVSGTPAANPGSVPAAFEPITRYVPSTSAPTRVFDLSQADGMMGMIGVPHRINNVTYDGARVDFTVPRGTLERWRFINRGMEPHPMHVHGTQFQVVSRNGSEALRLVTDLGWKDTVLVRPFETVEIALRFNVAANYVLHCHNLEHEDSGMMLNFDVV